MGWHSRLPLAQGCMDDREQLQRCHSCDGSCLYDGCVYESACNYPNTYNEVIWLTSTLWTTKLVFDCLYIGCTDAGAINYDEKHRDDVCLFPGCQTRKA